MYVVVILFSLLSMFATTVAGIYLTPDLNWEFSDIFSLGLTRDFLLGLGLALAGAILGLITRGGKAKED